LRLLKEKYHKASLMTVAPAKIKVSQRKRLPSTILSYTQTKTKNPLPKQTIVEPQTKIVQESQKRKGEELPHLVKRPTLLLGWRQDNGNRSNQESKFDFLATHQCLVNLTRDNKKEKSSAPTNNQIYGIPANHFSPSAGTTLA